MRTLRRIFAGLAGIFAFFALTSCGDAPDTAPETAQMRATILYAEGNGYVLAVPSEMDGSIPDAGDIYSPAVRDAEILDADGNPLSAEDLSAGQIVELVYDGSVREIYPAGITCSRVQVVGQQPEGWKIPVDLSQFFPDPDLDDPYSGMPSLGVEYCTGEVVQYTFSVRGSANWYEDGKGIAVDSVLPFDGLDRVPVISPEEGYAGAKLIFSHEPDSFALRYWEWEDLKKNGSAAAQTELSLDGTLFSWPEKTGKYLLEVSAEWENGHVSYYFATDSRPFALEMEEEIPLSAGAAAYTVLNRTGGKAEIFPIPQLERLVEDDKADGVGESAVCGYPRADADSWENVPMEVGFCGMPDPLEESREGSLSFSWWPGLEPGQYRFSLACSWRGGKSRVSCEFTLTEG